MRIGIAQTSPQFGAIDQNLSQAIELLSNHTADLWVLPELFVTGYQFRDFAELQALAEPVPSGPTTQALLDHATRYGCSIVAGLAEAHAERVFNACVLVSPSGTVAVYRKIHLFYKETLLFTPGDKPFDTASLGRARIGLMICFDHLFPESARSLALQGADLLAHPANLVLPDVAQRTMAIRSLENGVYSATANRVGQEHRAGETLTFTGQSQIVDPDGHVLVQLSRDRIEAAVVEIDLNRARDKRITAHNDKLLDRRPSLYTETRPQAR